MNSDVETERRREASYDMMMPKLNIGIIIKGAATDMERAMADMKALLQRHPNVRLVFSHTATNRLKIEEEQDGRFLKVKRGPETTALTLEEIPPVTQHPETLLR